MLLVVLAGCLDELLESPYVLAPGLGEVRAVSPGPTGDLLVASSTGVYRVDGNAVATRIGEPADGVTVHPGRVYVRRGSTITWEGGSVEAPGVIDVLAGYDALALLYPDRLELDARFETPPGPTIRVPLGRSDARAVALGPDGYLVVTESTLLALDQQGVTHILADGLLDARAAATDAKGRIYVAQGHPSELWRLDGGQLVSVARWLGDPRDLHFGLGGLLPTENIYVANGSGSLDYLRPP